MNCEPNPRILVVEDDALFAAFLLETLLSARFDAEVAEDGARTLETVAARKPALVLLDIDLPGLSGYEVCRELRRRFGDEIAIVFISGGRVDALDRSSGLLLGADDYLVKPIDPSELVARVRRLVASRVPAAEPATNGIAQPSALTPREQEVLRLLAAGRRQDEIAKRLSISPKTVATHIQRILPKLGARSRAEAVAFAHRDGLVV